MSRPPAVWAAQAEVRRAVVAHARRDRPRECCGFLLGREGSVEFAVPVRNLERSATRFRLDPRAHILWQRLLRDVRPRLAIIGVYHSHPRSAAVPSPSDIAEANYPQWLYIIVGVEARKTDVRAYRISRAQVRAIQIDWR